MRRARILHDGGAVPARYEGDTVVLVDGHGSRRRRRVPAAGRARLEDRRDASHLPLAGGGVPDGALSEYPNYFLMPPSSLSAHRAPVVRPVGTEYLNYEGELVVVMGHRCKDVAVEEALQYVAGYTIANDWGHPRLPPRRPRRDVPRQGPGRVLPDRTRRSWTRGTSIRTT
jgi:5-oxopent-3-ene-1,2,5-tricarboxylate decarboxylase/2-hydroxyhepta-2,4-diene-1,7-dioate isomerase